MTVTPIHILVVWFRGLLSLAVIAVGLGLGWLWYDASNVEVVERVVVIDASGKLVERDVATTRPAEAASRPRPRVFRFGPGFNRATAFLAGALVLLAWASIGRHAIRGVSLLRGKLGSFVDRADEDPRAERTGEVHMLPRPDGSVIRVECYGPVDAPPIVLTHGWGADSTVWFYPKRHLAERYRLILWDEPGLGLSKQPKNRDFRLETFASNLEAVLAFAGPRPVVLVGHSIGSMVLLVFCRMYPELLGTRVVGLVLAHGTYTNPIKTLKMAKIATLIEKPVLVPLLRLAIAIWPVVSAMNWLSYANGMARKTARDSGFGGTETRSQLDFAARFIPTARPDVLARGMFGMLAYDATDVLAKIPIPTLVVVGDQDETTVPEAGHHMARTIPGARIETLSPARHMGILEHNGRFDELVGQFVDSCQG